ncbi:MAG: mannitol dehydrogenase family protein [Actinomycetota bacterium]
MTAASSAALGVSSPTYDRSALRPAIVHIGVGGFHRAHLALYVDELCRAGLQGWSIVGAGILPGDVRMAEALDAQDHLYSMIIRAAESTEVRIIGSITDFVLGIDDLEPVVARIADPDTQIVSLTITEGGYPIDDATGAFDPRLPTAAAHSAFAAIVAGLDRRRAAGAGPVTVLSCDNIIGNGNASRTSTLGVAGRHDPELAGWIRANVTFPNSMVDRITPATTDDDRRWLEDAHGYTDRWPVVTEPFTQWVIEDDFAGDRLPLEEIDVIITDHVEPYELMKLRLLNAAHSCLSYLAALDDIEGVHDAMAAEHIGTYVREFLAREAKPMVPPVPGIDLDDYCDSLVERFSNPGVADQVSRLCLDGSVKFPKFLIPTIRAQLAADGPIELSTLALAAWCQYLGRVDAEGRPIQPAADPNLEEAVSHAKRAIDAPTAFLDFEQVFDADLRNDQRFSRSFEAALLTLRKEGVAAAINGALR